MRASVSRCRIPAKGGSGAGLIDPLAKLISNRPYLHFSGVLPHDCSLHGYIIVDPKLRIVGPEAFLLTASSAELDIRLEIGAAAEEAVVIVDLACESVGEFEVTLLMVRLASYKHKFIGVATCLTRTDDRHILGE